MSLREHPLAAPLSALVLAAAVFASTMVAGRQLVRVNIDEEARLRLLRTPASDAVPAPNQDCPREIRYAQSLPDAVLTDQVVQVLQAAAQANRVELTSIGFEVHAETDATAASLGVNIALRGSYSAIKSELADLAMHYPTLVLSRLKLSRTANGALTEDGTAIVQMPMRPPRMSPVCLVGAAAAIPVDAGTKR